MSAVVQRRAPPRANPWGRSAVFRPACLTALGLAIEGLEAMRSGPEMDGTVFRALGWQAEAPLGARRGWRVRSPLSSTWIAQPPVTTLADGAAILVPPGFDYSAGRRGAHAFAWVKRDDSTWFEASSSTPAIALARAALHAWRRILLETHP